MSAASDELDRLLAAMIGKPRWRLIASPNTGSRFTIEIGDRRLRPADRRGVQRESGEISLFVMCAWRLLVDDQTVCSSRDDSADGGPMQKGLAHLTGKPVSDASYAGFSKDSTLTAGPVRLEAFCDVSLNTIGRDSYLIYTSDEVLAVGHDGVVRVTDIDERPVSKPNEASG